MSLQLIAIFIFLFTTVKFGFCQCFFRTSLVSPSEPLNIEPRPLTPSWILVHSARNLCKAHMCPLSSFPHYSPDSSLAPCHVSLILQVPFFPLTFVYPILRPIVCLCQPFQWYCFHIFAIYSNSLNYRMRH